MRPVYLLGGDAISVAGRGVGAQARACIAHDTTASEIVFESPGGPGRLPYCRIADATGDRLAELIDVASTVLEHTVVQPRRRRRIGLFVGTSSGLISEHERAYASAHAVDQQVAPIHLPDQGRAASRLHAALALDGPSYTISTACSSAANALLYATWMVREGRIDDALVVGLEHENRLSQQGFYSLLLATRAQTRPFDLRRDGILLGECSAAALLSADRPKGGSAWRLRGGGTFCDTTHPTNPSPEKIAHTIRLALADAGVAPPGITAIKAHGTGTRANDLAEGLGLREVFGDQPPPFSSIKPVLGHTLGACGVLETLAFAAALDRGDIPATRNFEQPDPEIGIAPITTPQHWDGGAVLLNYFGFGGNNCALVLARET